MSWCHKHFKDTIILKYFRKRTEAEITPIIKNLR